MIEILQSGQNSATFLVEGPVQLALDTWAQLPHGRLRALLSENYAADIDLLRSIGKNGIMVSPTGSWREPTHHWWSADKGSAVLHIDSTFGYHVIIRVAVSYSAAD